MNKIDQIRAEIEKIHSNIFGDEYNHLLSSSDTLNEQPVCEGLEEAISAYIAPRLDKEYELYGEHRQKKNSKFNAYDLEEAIEYGAKWQREKMINEAVEVKVIEMGLNTSPYIIHGLPRNFKQDDKVKLIIIKED